MNIDIQKAIDNLFIELIPDDEDDIATSLKGIAKKLNQEYYNVEQDCDSNLIIVGSRGRRTAVRNTSDIDVLFVLPKSVYDRFNSYKIGGQSALLQDVKNKLLETYPRTDISGDGQVVVIEFCRYKIELVPCFKLSFNGYSYPDANNGGTWKLTNPLVEIRACDELDKRTDGDFRKLYRLVRCWKNNVGMVISGYAIDSVVYEYFLNSTRLHSNILEQRNYIKYFCDILNELYARTLFSPGGVALVDVNIDDAMRRKILKIKNKLNNGDIYVEYKNELIEAFGKIFEKCIETREIVGKKLYVNTEEFVEDKFAVDVKYNLKIDCKVEKTGFVARLLREMISKNIRLRLGRKLIFFVSSTNVSSDCDFYWKVRNVGSEAERLNKIRGQIIKDNGQRERVEHSSFVGPHFVECFAVKNGVCVARNKIKVTIEE